MYIEAFELVKEVDGSDLKVMDKTSTVAERLMFALSFRSAPGEVLTEEEHMRRQLLKLLIYQTSSKNEPTPLLAADVQLLKEKVSGIYDTMIAGPLLMLLHQAETRESTGDCCKTVPAHSPDSAAASRRATIKES